MPIESQSSCRSSSNRRLVNVLIHMTLMKEIEHFVLIQLYSTSISDEGTYRSPRPDIFFSRTEPTVNTLLQ